MFHCGTYGIDEAKKVHMLELPKQPVFKDVGRESEEKVVEYLVDHQIDDANPHMYFLLNFSLIKRERG